MRLALLAALVVCMAPSLQADTYWVTNLADAGAGSLRQAITDANSHLGADTIQFRKRLAGKTIALTSPLPTVSGLSTLIEGDIDGNGTPDIALNGVGVGSGDGLAVTGWSCTISGLTIMNFPENALRLADADYATVRSCNLGVRPDGAAQAQCGQYEVLMQNCDYCTIGATGAARNVFSGGARYQGGVAVVNGNSNTIAGNYFGIRRDGTASLGYGEVAVLLTGSGAPCDGNTVGGTTAGQRNVMGHLGWGVKLVEATSSHILGNYMGVLPDGTTGLSVTMSTVSLGTGCYGNIIGGTTAGARNVLVGSGIDVLDGAGSNTVRGNYIGFNAAGTQQKEMIIGVGVDATAPQTIGGNSPEAGNWFAAKGASYAVKYGVALTDGGGGSLIRHNHFGKKPAGGDAPGLWYAIATRGVTARVLDNDIANSGYGVECTETGANATVAGNTFRDCGYAVAISNGAKPCLGDLNDASGSNDGANQFDPSNSEFIRNETPNLIRAEGNDFGTTSKAEINLKVHDRQDDPAVGWVDFNPLAGGVLPTTATLMVTGATAAPSRGGAEVAFSLSAPADVSVTVVNLAGRPVAAVWTSRPADAGLQRLIWSGRSSQGTAVPGGVYLLRIAARDSSGREATALARLSVGR